MAFALPRTNHNFAEELRTLARRPIMPQVRNAWNEPGMKRQLAASFVCNAVSSLVLPVGVLAARRGFNLDNSMVMKLTLSQTGVMIAAAWVFPKVIQVLGICRSLIYFEVCLCFFSWSKYVYTTGVCIQTPVMISGDIRV